MNPDNSNNKPVIAGYLTAPKIRGYFPLPTRFDEDNKKWSALENKKRQRQILYLEGLERTGVIKLAMKQAGVGSRQTLVNWRLYEPGFNELEIEAITNWKGDIDDLAVGGLIVSLQAREEWAIKYWLDRRHQDFKPKSALSVDSGGELEKQRSSLLALQNEVLSQLKHANNVEATITQSTPATENASA